MLATLFYDDVETDSTLHIPYSPLNQLTERADQSHKTCVDKKHHVVNHLRQDVDDPMEKTRCTFHGTLDMPEVDAVLMWWVSGCNRLNILVVNDRTATTVSHSSHCQILPIQLPVSSFSELLTCGVTKQSYGGQCIAVSWVSKSFRCGMVCLTVQRDGCGLSSMKPMVGRSFPVSSASTGRNTRGKVVLTIDHDHCINNVSLADIQQVFTSEDCKKALVSLPNTITSQGEDGANSFCEDLEISACVLSEVPAEDREIGTIFVITNGVSIWRVMLYLDGHVSYDAFVDNKRYERSVNRANTADDKLIAQEGLLALVENRDLLHCPNLQTWPSLQRIAQDTVNNISLSPFCVQQQRTKDDSFGGNEGSKSSWLSSFFTGRSRMHETRSSFIPGAIPKRRYFSVSAVLNSPGWFVLLRWDGLLEFYDGTSENCNQMIKLVPTCRVAGINELSPNTSFCQWSRFSPGQNIIDVVTSATSRPTCPPTEVTDGIMGDQHVFFTSVPTNLRLPLTNSGEPQEVIALRNSVELSPPFPSCVLMGCTTSLLQSPSISGERKLTLLWAAFSPQSGVSATSQSSHRRSIAAILQSDLPASGRTYNSILQTLETTEIEGSSFRSAERTAVSSRTFFADGGSLCAIHAHNEMTLVVERYMNYHRIHATECAPARSIEGLMESLTLCPPQRFLCQSPNELLESKFPSKGLRSLHFTPSDSPPCCRADFLDEAEDDCLEAPEVERTRSLTSQLIPATAFSAFFAIVEAIERHPDGAGLVVDVVRDILEGRTSLLTVERFREELQLDPFLSRKYVTPPMLREGLKTALTYVVPNNNHNQQLFFNFSRYYVYHNISRCLLYRLAFVCCLYIGWCSSGVPLNNAEPLSSELLLSLEYLSAAFFVTQTAGPDLVTLGARLSVKKQNGEEMEYKDAVLYSFLSTDILQNKPESLIYRCLDIAVALYGCSKGHCHNSVTLVPRCEKALEVWALQLSQRVPMLKHFVLLKELEAGRTNCTSEIVLPHCWQVMESIAALPSTTVVVDVLLNKGFLLTDCTGNSTSFSGMRLDELQELLLTYPEVAPKIYAIGLLRRLVAPRGALLLASASCVSTFFMAELLTVIQCVEAMGGLFVEADGKRPSPSHVALTSLPSTRELSLSSVITGLKELHIDVLLALSVSAWEDGEITHAFHHIENAYRIISKTSLYVKDEQSLSQAHPLSIISNRCSDLNRVVNDIVHRICHSFSLSALSNFQNLPSLSPALEEWITEKWADEIISCADEEGITEVMNCNNGDQTDCDDDDLFRSALVYGLYQFLMQRHIYGQCGRVMSTLAAALRCSPWCRQRSPIITRLTTLALHSVQLINSFDQTQGKDDSIHVTGTDKLNPISNEKPVYRLGSSGSSERALSPIDLPWLRLRVHQAQCEASLWSLGLVMDSWIDLWVEDAPYENICDGAMHLLNALQDHCLWEEAFRFSVLFSAAYHKGERSCCRTNGINNCVTPDPCTVLKHWVTHILCIPVSKFSNDYSSDVSMLDLEDQWDSFLRCCAECSSLENQFMGFHSAVTAALRTDYMKTSPKLLEAYRIADPYSALKTLLQIYSSFQVELANCSADILDSGMDNSLPLQTEKLIVLSCLTCIDAAYIALDALERHADDDSLFCFTAGVFDSLAIALQRLEKSSPAILKSVDNENIHRLFLNKLTESLESRGIP